MGEGSPSSSSIVQGEKIDLLIGLLMIKFEGAKALFESKIGSFVFMLKTILSKF